MPKTIKEVYSNYTGVTTIEYSDDTTRTYTVDDVPTVQSNPLTGGRAIVAPNIGAAGFDNFMPALTAVTVGNSIVTAQKYGGFGTDWRTTSEVHIANALAGSPLVFPRITPSTRADQYAVYGYSGATLTTINADLQAQLWTPLQTAGIVPGIALGLALTENDIATAVAFEAIQKQIIAFVRDVRSRFPGAILLLATPRPSFTYNTPSKVSVYQQVRDYILSLDNGCNIFVARLDTYENPASPGTPLGTAGAPIFTDSTVHPNGRGAMRNARVLARALSRISASFKQSYGCVATNMSMRGSGVASGTNVSGTVPTSVSVSGSGNGTYISTAEQPGFLLTITANASGSEPPVDLATSNVASVSVAGGAATQLSPFVEFEIVSGAENLSWLSIRPRFTGSTSGNVLTDFVKRNTGNVDPEFQNGDTFMWRVPPRMAGDITGLAGNFAGCQIYFQAWPKITGGTFSFRIKSAGVGIVVP